MKNGYIISNTPIAIDYWHVSTKPHVRFFFLTHCHADHTQGLTKSWKRRIYCSSITAKLAGLILGVDSNLFVPIEVDQTLTIDYDDDQKFEKRSFHVTALEADHCPGSIMFLFDGWFGRILCTGDFRYEKNAGIIDIGRLQAHRIDRLYLDGTNWGNTQNFPARDAALDDVLRTIGNRPSDEVILLAMPQARLGKERLLVAISRQFGQRICVDATRVEATKLLQLDQYFTTNANETRFHVVGGSQWKISKIFDDFACKNCSVFVLIATSLPEWRSHVECAGESFGNSSYNSKNAAVIPYSDHSSRQELETFLGSLRIEEIILTGCRSATLSREECDRFQEDEVHSEPGASRMDTRLPPPEEIVVQNVNAPEALDMAAAGDIIHDDSVMIIDEPKPKSDRPIRPKFLTTYENNFVFTNMEIDAIFLMK